jgi:hypothetical protein
MSHRSRILLCLAVLGCLVATVVVAKEFDKPNKMTWTLHKQRSVDFLGYWLGENYDAAASLLADDVVADIKGVGVIPGKQPVVDYLHLGGRTSSEFVYMDEIKSATLIQEEKSVMAVAVVTSGSPLLPPGQLLDAVGTETQFNLEFNDQDLIRKVTIFVDPAGLAKAFRLVLQGAADVVSLCTRIQTDCTGADQQYSSVEQCLGYMASIRFVDVDYVPRLWGNSVACRYLHANMAETNHDHCNHAGTKLLDPWATPCQDFSQP